MVVLAMGLRFLFNPGGLGKKSGVPGRDTGKRIEKSVDNMKDRCIK